MRSSTRFAGLLIALAVLGISSNAAAALMSFQTRGAFTAFPAEQALAWDREGFGRVKSVKNGGQRSFADGPLVLDDFTLSVVTRDDADAPRVKHFKNGNRRGLNRITKNGWMRINRSKFARVAINDGVDFVIEFNETMHAFGAAFRGLNNGRQTSILIDGVLGFDSLEIPQADNNRDRGFFGFYSEEGFRTITFSGTDVFAMDRLLFAAPARPVREASSMQAFSPAADSAVPLPGTLLLLSLGMLGATTLQMLRRVS